MANWIEIACDHIGIDYGGYKRRLMNIHKKRSWSFISIHYCWIIGWAIVGSIIIYGNGSNIAYIDALFFASGAATQSGLNTVDVNTLQLYQQITTYLMTFFCTPIWINSFVVLVRLYWFEKRFQHIVHEARSNRQSRTRSFSRRESADAERANSGVNGRPITVLRNTVQPVETADGFREKTAMETVPEYADSSSSSGAEKPEQSTKVEPDEDNDPLHSPRAIRFPDETFPDRNDRSIAFLQKQRNESSTKPLRIPGPREADEGAVPEEVEGQQDVFQEDEEDRPHGILKNRTESQSHSIRPNVTIEEPQRPLHSSNTAGRNHRRVPSNPYALRSPSTNANDNEEASATKKRRNSTSSMARTNSQDAAQGTVSYLSWQPTVGRNSLFIDLTEEQREELGGIEYRALKTLTVVLAWYYVFFHVLGAAIFAGWINKNEQFGPVVDAAGQNRIWWGIYSGATFFNDLGFTLTPDSFISFQLSVLVLLLGSFLIVIGNTGFPCMLRFVLWLISKCCNKEGALYEEIRFLLDHPRRCFTLLFPGPANWVLFAILVLLNGIDLLFFVILDLNDPVVTSLPPAFKFLDGLFQAVSTRTAGTACVNLAGLHPGIQVSYLIMMYISVFPIAISVRRTNVYEERSLGIYSAGGEEDDDKEANYVGAHLRKQLSFDLWFIFAGLFIIAIAEGSRISADDEPAFNLFSILFEIVSAYGTVGLSLGYPGINASFSAEFSVVSKLVIIAMQIRGRHRGLPYGLDKAILLPSETSNMKEQEEAQRHMMRRASTLNLDGSNGESLMRSATQRTNRSDNARTTGREGLTQAVRHRDVHEIIQARPHAKSGIGKMVAATANTLTASKQMVGKLTKVGPKEGRSSLME